MLLPVTRELAQRLLAYEAVASEVSQATERASFGSMKSCGGHYVRSRVLTVFSHSLPAL